MLNSVGATVKMEGVKWHDEFNVESRLFFRFSQRCSFECFSLIDSARQTRFPLIRAVFAIHTTAAQKDLTVSFDQHGYGNVKSSYLIHV